MEPIALLSTGAFPNNAPEITDVNARGKLMKRSINLGILIAAASMTAVTAFAAIESGLRPGATPGAFQVVDVTGPNKGKQLCYRCQYGTAPVLAAFVNGDAAKSEKLVE